MSMSTARYWLIAVLVLLAVVVLTACGGDDGGDDSAPRRTTTPGTPAPAASVTPTPTQAPPTELRVAFVNLNSPLTLDADDPVAGDTFEARLKLIVQELQAFNPDVVGFNEASWTAAHGNARTYLATELKMETVYFRANPWLPGTSREQSDALTELSGFEEGEMFLVRSDRWPLAKDPEIIELAPRTSETGERRIAIHLTITAADPVDEIDLYLTHLTGGGDGIRERQAQDFAEWIRDTRGTGPAIVMGDFSELPDSEAMAIFKEYALTDVLAGQEVGTCCRESVVGEQPELTSRTDYILAGRWMPYTAAVFGDVPGQRADGTPLYASDHNGLVAVFDLSAYLAAAAP